VKDDASVSRRSAGNTGNFMLEYIMQIPDIIEHMKEGSVWNG
jgi:hypothetical protein